MWSTSVAVGRNRRTQTPEGDTTLQENTSADDKYRASTFLTTEPHQFPAESLLACTLMSLRVFPAKYVVFPGLLPAL